ncbi:MAG TPA: DMT family transporter [Luteibacter sp.]|jgi:drug/metabolite transporter (DMT)-like permease|nr:DMT family transporter [Luteibacter sp.]
MSPVIGLSNVGAAIALGLAAAALYGLTDLLAGLAARRVGTPRTMFYGHLLGACGFTGWVLYAGVPTAPLASWLVALLSNALGLAATASLYRALALGPLSIVSPVAATYGVISAVLSVVTGESLTTLAWLGVILATAGGAIMARQAPTPGSVVTGGSGPLFAVAAALAYGISFWLQGRYAVPALGFVVPVATYYLLGVVAIGAYARVLRLSLAAPSGRSLVLVLSTAIAAVGGSLALAAGQATGHVAIVTVMSALASAVTVLLAWAVLKEPVRAAAWAALGVIVLGLALLHAT